MAICTSPKTIIIIVSDLSKRRMLCFRQPVRGFRTASTTAKHVDRNERTVLRGRRLDWTSFGRVSFYRQRTDKLYLRITRILSRTA